MVFVVLVLVESQEPDPLPNCEGRKGSGNHAFCTFPHESWRMLMGVWFAYILLWLLLPPLVVVSCNYSTSQRRILSEYNFYT